MKTSEFAEKYLDLKLEDYQKTFLDKEYTEQELFRMGRKGSGIGYSYVLIKTMQYEFEKNILK